MDFEKQRQKGLRMADSVTKTETKSAIAELGRRIDQAGAWTLPQFKAFCGLLEASCQEKPQMRAMGRVAIRNEETARSAEKRLWRHSQYTCFDEPIETFCKREACARMRDWATVAIDHTDLDHPYGTEEGSDYFPTWDGSRHLTSVGDTVTTAFLLTPGSREGFPIFTRLHEERLTPIQRAIEAMREVSAMAQKCGKHVRIVMDRGMDAMDIYAEAARLEQAIVVRVRHERDLIGDTSRPLAEALRALRGKCARIRMGNKLSENVKIHVAKGFLSPLLPPIVVIGVYWDNNKHLVLNATAPGVNLDSPSILWEFVKAAVQAYFDRWGIEIFFRSFKQLFDIESLLLRDIPRRARLLRFLLLAYIFLIYLIDETYSYSRIVDDLHANLHRIFPELLSKKNSFIQALRYSWRSILPNRARGRPKKAGESFSNELGLLNLPPA